jgi:hypothetical protein
VQSGQISKQRIGARRHFQFTSVDQFNCAHFWSEKLTTPAAYFRHGENHRFVDRRSNPDLRGNLRAIGWEFPQKSRHRDETVTASFSLVTRETSLYRRTPTRLTPPFKLPPAL